MKIKGRSNLWLVLILLLICSMLISCSHVQTTKKQDAIRAEVEIYELFQPSIENKVVNNKEYHILTFVYFNSNEQEKVKKSVLVDFDAGCCLWNSEEGINDLNNNESCNTIYDDGFECTEGTKNSITIQKKFYTDNNELAHRNVKITLTKSDYERIVSS